jgi:hypothetical protein
MADANTLPIEFSIVGFEQMQRDFAALSSRVDDMAGSVSKNSKAMTTGFKDVAANAKRSIASTTANLRSLLPVLGGTQAQFVMMASNVGEQFEKLATASGSTAAMIKGGLVVAVAAASYEFGKWTAEVIGLNDAIDAWYKNAQRASIISPQLSDAMRMLATASEEYAKAQDDIGQRARLFGESADTSAKLAEATEKSILATDSALKAFASTQGELTDKLSIQINRVWDLRAAYANLDDTLKDTKIGADIKERLETESKEMKRLQTVYESVRSKVKESNDALNEQINLYGDLITVQRMYEEDAKRKPEVAATQTAAAAPVFDIESMDLEEQTRLMSLAIGDEMANAYAYVERYNIPALVSEQIQQTDVQFRNWVASMQLNVADVQMFIMDTFSAATQGIGNAIAQAVVYGENLGKLFEELGKQILASVISTLLQLLIQELMYLVLGSFIMAADLTAKISAMAAFAAAAAYAWAVASMGLIGMAVGPGLAVEAAAMTTAAGAYGAGIGAAAGPGIAGIGQAGGLLAFGEGAYVRSPVMALVGDAPGGEIVAPRSDYEAMIATARQPSVGHVYLDGRELTQSVVKWIPGEVRRKGVKGI